MSVPALPVSSLLDLTGQVAIVTGASEDWPLRLGMGLLLVLRIPAPPAAFDHFEVATAG